MKFITKIAKSYLFKITSLNSLSVILKIFSGLITSKLLAIFVGPSGMAIVGNLRNFVSSLEGVSTLGFQNGIVKYVTDNKSDKQELNRIIATVFVTLLILATILSTIIFFFSNYLNLQIFGLQSQYVFVIKALAIALPWYGISIFFLSVINGLGRFKNVIIINILGNILGLITSIFLIYYLKTTGALLSVVVSPALLFFASFYYLNTEIQIFKRLNFHDFDVEILKKLSAFSLMALFSAVFGPLVYLAIRKNIILNLGLVTAGYWESMTRISSYYLLFVTTIISIYYLPKLIESKNNEETKNVFHSFYKFILPIFVFGLIVIYFMRFFIIKILLTKEFLPVTDLFFWQIIGDIIKVATLILGYQFFAKKLIAAFIISEVLSLTVLYFSSIYLLKIFGIQGIVIAQTLDNFLYLLGLIIYFRKSLF